MFWTRGHWMVPGIGAHLLNEDFYISGLHLQTGTSLGTREMSHTLRSISFIITSEPGSGWHNGIWKIGVTSEVTP